MRPALAAAAEVLAGARAAGLRLEQRGPRLVARGPEAAVRHWTRPLRYHRAEVAALLTAEQEASAPPGELSAEIEAELVRLLAAWHVPADQMEDYRGDLRSQIERDGEPAMLAWLHQMREDFEAERNKARSK